MKEYLFKEEKSYIYMLHTKAHVTTQVHGQCPFPFTHTTAARLSTQPLQLPSKGFVLELASVMVLKEISI